MRTTVQQIGAGLVGPAAHRLQGVEHGQHAGDAVAHRDVHHLALAGRTCLDHGGEQPDDEKQGAAAVVADEIERATGSPSCERKESSAPVMAM